MEDSLRGILIVFTVVGLFITAILNFIVLFPQEQGVNFNDLASADSYLSMSQNSDTGNINALNYSNNQTSNAFNEWDITTGFMGTNQLKQSQSGINTYSKNIFTSLNLIATKLFGKNSPIIYALTVLSLLTTGYITYLVVKWVRTGN